MRPAGEEPTVIVGVDGSERANTALRVAIDEAIRRGARLRVVCAWEHFPAGDWGEFPPSPEELDLPRRHAEEIVREALSVVRRQAPGLECEGSALEGQPAEVLVREAGSASLIVLGDRGRGGFASLLLGSVTQQVVHHAACPILVVPHGRTPA